MEQHVKNSLPDFNMFDYKVNYENHSSFTDSGNKKRKFGSPVRIFTNIPLFNLNLKDVPGYKFCGPCGFWVSNENKHCKECNGCMSKNGRTYIHCKKCSKCVKPSYKHCDTCSRCCLPDHVCGQFQPDTNCYHCHQPGHKKRECVLLNVKTKRCLSDPEVSKKKRKVAKIMLGKTRVKLILLMTAVNLVFSCLVTNCPRGGKRGKPNLQYPPNNIINSGLKKCKLCSPDREICLGIYCSSEISCKYEGHCVTQEVCCSKRFCNLQKSCELDFLSPAPKEPKPNSIFLTKILMYNLAHGNNWLKPSEE